MVAAPPSVEPLRDQTWGGGGVELSAALTFPMKGVQELQER